MFLEKIEIQGFKSFAKKTVLKFAHEETKDKNQPAHNIGLTVIVGPNGSGKSNVADAVRWVLGEQSVKMLRGKKSEDIIFAGSHKKASLSFAEVSLYLNNSDKKTKIDYTQLVITHRLYRDGEGEYLINNNKVRLLDVQLLLARAHFGQRAYSVVGQGMVENFLNTTPAERKEFFDEATGVKMYQLKKHDASNKLKNAQQNLEKAESLLNEIEPRMKSLTRQIKKLKQRAQLETELYQAQKNYYAGLWHDWSKQLKEVNQKVVAHEERQREIAKNLKKINEDLTECERNQYNTPQRDVLEKEQKQLRFQRDSFAQDLAEIRAKKNVALEISGKSDEVWLLKKARELEQGLEMGRADLQSALAKEVETKKQVERLRRDQRAVDEKIVGLRKLIIDYHSEGARDASGTVLKIKEILQEVFSLHDAIDKSLNDNIDIAVIKKHWRILRLKMASIKNLAEAGRVNNDADLVKINNDIIKLEEQKNKLTQEHIRSQSELTATQHNIVHLKQSLARAQVELDEINKKLLNKQKTAGKNNKQSDHLEVELVEKIKSIDAKISDNMANTKRHYDEEKKQRDVIIVLQKKAHIFQEDYNQTTSLLSEVSIDKARIETKIEDLENEIRQEFKSLREIIDCHSFQAVDAGQAQDLIHRLKKQLELIGGIDPEIQKEYAETKERFDFLEKQSTDLRGAINSLSKIIVTLDKTITEQFDKSFVEIAKQFEKYFKILFDGGSVHLEKILEEEKKAASDEIGSDDMDKVLPKPVVKEKKVELRATKKIFTGIDVRACPPNKKIKNISSLSGGERALTSIALIAAIIAVNPSPFVMLDEVDAALDEANSTRLAKILEDLSKKTQFIAITHNRTIMYKADIIYGVTMGDDGISKLLSVKVSDVSSARR